MQRAIDRMEQHVIVCGYGRFGIVVTEELKREVDVVVVEADPDKESLLTRDGVRYVIGSAVQDDVLERAHPHTAVR